MKKRISAIILVTAMSVSLLACSKTEEVNNESQKEIQNETENNTEEQNKSAVEIKLDKSEVSNPLTGFDSSGKLIYGGDPAALVDGDTVYLYTGHDTATDEAYKIPEWQCYSTKDMVNWTYEGVVLKASQISWADKNSAWAGQVTKYNNKYYFYYCSWDSTDDGKQSIGVGVSDSPVGPFVDKGTALVKGSFTTDETSGWNDIDPTVWIEKDESGVEHRYLCWGNGKVYMCELNEDMISIKDIDNDGEIIFGKDVISQKAPESFTEAPWIYRRQDENGQYYGKYYLFYAYGWREQMAYATTDDLMNGQWEFKGVIMEPSATSNTNHMSVIDFNDKTYFIYHNGSLPGGSGFRRVACVEELIFNEDGSVPYIQETATGISGSTVTITSLNGEKLVHEQYNNSSKDSAYPYTGVKIGAGLSNEDNDGLWEIEPGKADKNNEFYVSIESYNKPGLYITGTGKVANLSQDATGRSDKTQTFRTVEGLAGEGVSFESVAFPGKYLTLYDGSVKLTDGKDAKACSFIIE